MPRGKIYSPFWQVHVRLELRESFFEESLSISLTSIWDQVRKGYYFVPKLKYALSDSSEFLLKVNIFGGSDDSVFGLYKENTGMFAQIIQYFDPCM